MEFWVSLHPNPKSHQTAMAFFTYLILLHFTPSFFEFPIGFRLGLVPNFGFLVASIYALFYVFMDKKAGPLTILFACWVSASLVAKHLEFALAWKVVLAAQLFCWTELVIGHGVFEKGAPALPENLTQTILMEHFYVLLEVLQWVFGYEPYPGFDATVKAKRDAEIKELQEKKGKKIVTWQTIHEFGPKNLRLFPFEDKSRRNCNVALTNFMDLMTLLYCECTSKNGFYMFFSYHNRLRAQA